MTSRRSITRRWIDGSVVIAFELLLGKGERCLLYFAVFYVINYNMDVEE